MRAEKWSKLAEVTSYAAGTIFHHADQADPEWRSRYQASAEAEQATGQSDNKQSNAGDDDKPWWRGKRPVKFSLP